MQLSRDLFQSHIPVLCQEMLAHLAPQDGQVVVDGTFGWGGYSQAILEVAKTHVIGIDRDPEAIVRAHAFAQMYPNRFRILEGTFGQMTALLQNIGMTAVDGIVLDLGVSSSQLDQAERGFSFRLDGPLDMRMGRHGQTAAEWINDATEEEIADVIYHYGEEHNSRRIARAIVRHRVQTPILRTQELASLVRGALGARGNKGTDPATKTFMALRIFINDELEELRKGLAAAEQILKIGGHLIVVTFHSLEDRIVKEFFQGQAHKRPRSRYLPLHPLYSTAEEASCWQMLHRKPMTACSEEVMRNPRSRSAKLRAACKTSASKISLSCVVRS